MNEHVTDMTVDPAAEAATLLAHDERHFGDAVVPPIFQTSLFTFPSYEEMEAAFAGKRARPVYSRGLNPTVRAFEEKVAQLEKTEDALGFGSGMAAISSSVLAFVRPGDRILAVEHLYPDAFRFFETLLKAFEVSVDYVDGGDLSAVEAMLPGHKVLYLESPTSWMFQALDLEVLARMARAHGAVTVVDNSWASPVFQNPIALGCDLSIHSASKYLGGHSDVVAGVVAGRGDLIGKLRREILPYLGGKLSPFDAWLLLRGLRTLPARMREHERSALDLAGRLAGHSAVTAVHHPALAGRVVPPGLKGTSGLFSIELHPAIDIPAFCNSLRLFKLGVSWGGHESLVCPAGVTHVQVGGPNHAVRFDVPKRMVRLNIGLESAEALWSDLVEALQIGATKGRMIE
jgi:cystathionine beta-lyase/cystathionine gamma-synthase